MNLQQCLTRVAMDGFCVVEDAVPEGAVAAVRESVARATEEYGRDVAKAKELLMTGDFIDAQEAERIGLINKVVPHDDLMETVMDLARRLASGPALAIRGTKHALNKRIWEELNLVLDVGLALEERSFRHEDHKEAARSFVEKREPQYKGGI